MMKPLVLASALVASSLAASTAIADRLDDVLRVGQNRTEAAQESQQRIDQIADQTRTLLTEYKQVNKQIEGLKVYNSRLERQIANQEQRMADIDESIADITVIQRQILPLAIRMVDGLEEFVNLDLPFHMEERQGRIEFLRENMDRSDLSTAEKFRQVLEAYKIENEYGRKLDSYTDTINLDGSEREVNILRIGRIALLYQTTDLNNFGYWDQESDQWTPLSGGEFRSAITKGIRMANKQASIDILTVPVPAPEAQ